MSEPDSMEEGISQEGSQVRGIACAYIKQHRRTSGFPGAARRGYNFWRVVRMRQKSGQARDEKAPQSQNKGLGDRPV